MQRNDEVKLAQTLADLIKKMKVEVKDMGTYLLITQGNQSYRIDLSKRESSRLNRYR